MNSSGGKAAGKARILNITFFVLFFVSCCNYSVSYMVNTIFSDYSLVILGTTISMAGRIVSMTSIGGLIVTPFCGPANNRLDKRRLIQAAMLIYVLTSIGFSYSRSIPLIMVLRLFSGFGSGIALTSGMVMVVESLPEMRVTEGVGYYGLSSILMEAIGPVIAISLVERFGYEASFSASGAISLIGFFVAFKLPQSVGKNIISNVPEEKAPEENAPEEKAPEENAPEENAPEENAPEENAPEENAPEENAQVDVPTIKTSWSFSTIIKESFVRESLLPTSVGSLFALINGVQQTFIIPYAKHLDLAFSAGSYFTVLAVTMFTARLLLGRFVQKRTFAFAVIFSGMFLLGCPILLGIGNSGFTFLLAAFFFGIGYGVLLPVTQSTSVKFAPPQRRGSGSSTYFMGIRLSFFVAPIAGGLIAESFGYSRMFLLLIIPALVAMLLGFAKGRVPINPEHQAKK